MNEIGHFLLWANNMPIPTQQWFQEVWPGHLGNHFWAKWTDNRHRYNGCTQQMVSGFFPNLSLTNQNILTDWVNKNFKG